MRVSIFVIATVVAALTFAPGASPVTRLAQPAVAEAATAQTYIVLYQQQAVATNAGNAIRQAGGTLVYAYDQIGVAIASSANPSFREDLLKLDGSVENAAATAAFATRLRDVADAEGPPPGELPNAPATDADTFSGFQWNMRQI